MTTSTGVRTHVALVDIDGVASKECTTCGVVKPLEDFTLMKTGKGGRAASCKVCRNEAQRGRRLDPEALRRYNLKRYGITPEQYDALLEKQDGRCAICVRLPEEVGFRGVLHVDHDHETDEVRGLLCGDCNLGLGRFDDDVALMLRAIDYLMGVAA